MGWWSCGQGERCGIGTEQPTRFNGGTVRSTALNSAPSIGCFPLFERGSLQLLSLKFANLELDRVKRRDRRSVFDDPQVFEFAGRWQEASLE